MGIFRFFVFLFLLVLSSVSMSSNIENAGILSLGSHHTCALDDTGVVCWGRNDHGQISVPF